MTSGRFRQRFWVVPLAIAGLVAIFGWWGNTRLRISIEQQLKAELTTTLDANATALEIWMADQARLAASLADEPRVRTLATKILESSEQPTKEGKGPPDLLESEELASYLRPRLNKVGYDAAELVNTNFMVVANARRGKLGPVSEAHLAKLAELFASGQPVIITPYKPEIPASRRLQARAVRAATPEAARARRGDFTLMQVAAPIRDTSNAVCGALALVINPDKEFTKILSVARSGKSGETYAFDQHGLLISRSRFDDQLKKLGLLDATNTSSALNLRLHDPTAALVEGTRPLTHIVSSAIGGEAGVELEPSRDYRGVEVVGAWRWLPDHGFGVATQIDATEAYQPLHVLKLLFVALILLLLLCANGMFIFSYTNFVWRRRLSEAELKVKQLGQYTLEEKIGEGGMGVVYRARHTLMRRDTAVKLLLPDRADSAAIQRFEREVCLTCQLTHPNTIQVYDYGHTPDGIFYYAMEFLRGLNLHELVARFGPQPEARVIHILIQVCDALSEAHALGLVHRDIKPANVFLCDRGGLVDFVKVLDFGLVREYRETGSDQVPATVSSQLEGTPWFMPPEAIRNSSLSDPRGDIYSVGALGYYLLTGAVVFDSPSVDDLCEQHLTQSPIPPSQRSTNPVSPELERAILGCLEKDPSLRPQSASELHGLLAACTCAVPWTAEDRTAWWTSYRSEALDKSGSGNPPAPSPIDVTVNVDFASRS
ncbi:MAG: Serine/threonine protein kinaserelated protein [Pedosphaera sp.]|nr:Serine/threonine protein kinaserelated protein [Pedosphaera sp.]